MKKNEKNILLVSLENLENGIQYRYFYHDEDVNAKYCNGILQAEVATKYVLSQVDIDEIVVISSGATYDDGDDLHKTLLGEGDEFIVADIESLSEYSLYRYRITEFLEGLDLEEYELLADIDEEEKSILVKTFNQFHNELRTRTKRRRKDIVFDLMRKEPALFDELTERLPEELKSKATWLKHYIYSILTDSYKLRALEANEDVMISFIPTTNHRDGNVDLENISRIIDVLTSGEEEVINLYIDMQGLERTDDFTMVTVFSILKNEWKNKIHVKNILSTGKGAFASEIKNERRRYEINDLLAGMNAFIQYGKVGSLRKYWEERGIFNEHIENLLFAMQYIDDGVSLCNIADLEYGICELKKVLAETADRNQSASGDDGSGSDGDDGGPSLESNVIGILESGIRRDFGPLLDGDADDIDVLELVKWTYRKEFYQQTLTILESRIPRDFVNRGVLYYAQTEGDKALAIDFLSKEYNEAPPKDRYQFLDINHYFIKFYGRSLVKGRQDPAKVQQDFAKMRVSLTEERPEGHLMSYSLVENKDELEELIFAYVRIGGIRNQVSHGKSGLKQYPGQRIVRRENRNVLDVKEAVDYFIQQYDAVKTKIAEKDVVSLTVSSEEIKDHAAKGKRGFRKGRN